MNGPIFASMSARLIAARIASAQKQVCFSAPGIQDEAAEALRTLKASKPNVAITVRLDFDEHTLRMGYGSLQAVEILRSSGIEASHWPGFRAGILIVDDEGWVFTPTARYLESEPQSHETPNAFRLTADQVKELLLRLSPMTREKVIASAATQEEATRLDSIPVEVSDVPLDKTYFEQVKKGIETAPPVNFDVARQVRVFEPYLQYVELSLVGAAIQKHRIAIPEALQHLGSTKELQGRLKTTFELIEKKSSLSSKELEEELNEIRKNFTPSLGKSHGRVVLKSAKPKLQKRLAALRKKLEEHQKRVEKELEAKLDESKKQVIDYYFPLVKSDPPDALVGSLVQVTDDGIRDWIEVTISKAFPDAATLIHKMRMEERYKDVTFETLNCPDFVAMLKKAFPRINWEKAYDEFKAAGEKTHEPRQPSP